MNRKGERQYLINKFVDSKFSFVRYEIELKAAKKNGIRKGAINGMLMGIIFCLMFSTYGLV
jgi:tetrahydromethanopterin S-methyltransferase subunit G